MERDIFQSLITVPPDLCRTLGTATLSVKGVYAALAANIFRDRLGQMATKPSFYVPFVLFVIAKYCWGRGYLPPGIQQVFPAHDSRNSRERVLAHERHIRLWLVRGTWALNAGITAAIVFPLFGKLLPL